MNDQQALQSNSSAAAQGNEGSFPLLTAKNVSKTYRLGKRSVEVLRSVNLTIGRGEFVALKGASGSGKSTLLHLLGGLDSPNTGDILFAGTNFARLSESKLAHFRNLKIGFIFQAYHVLPELDALENVCLPARMARVDAGQTKTRAIELLRRVGLSDRMEHRPYELSGGEQQRVAVARALINKPELILADEPTGNLDSHTGQGIIDLLNELQREQGSTLVIVTHDSKVASQAPRIVELIDGQLHG